MLKIHLMTRNLVFFVIFLHKLFMLVSILMFPCKEHLSSYEQ